RLPVAFLFLGAEIAGPTANRIGLQQHELAIAILLPDLHLRLFFEDPSENRGLFVHVFRRDLGDHLFGQWGLCPARGRNALSVTAGQSNRSGNSRRRQQRASERSFQTGTPRSGGSLSTQWLPVRCGIRKAFPTIPAYR